MSNENKNRVVSRRDLYIEFKCPKCEHTIPVPRCFYCKYSERNWFDYKNAKECHECDMFHKEFKLMEEI